MNLDLNNIPLTDADTAGGQPQKDFSVETKNVSVAFKNLEQHLIKFIEPFDAIVGCVAWLTNQKILKALAAKKVLIIVQKEDFLRPDSNTPYDWKNQLQKSYLNLKTPEPRDLLGWRYSSGISLSSDAIRCVGVHNSDKKSAAPRMHHKFIVGLRRSNPTKKFEREFDYTPAAVWSGSFNFTYNGTHSLENAVIIKDPKIATAYFNEWIQIYGLSENLNWETTWVQPEYRFGT